MQKYPIFVTHVFLGGIFLNVILNETLLLNFFNFFFFFLINLGSLKKFKKLSEIAIIIVDTLCTICIMHNSIRIIQNVYEIWIHSKYDALKN